MTLAEQSPPRAFTPRCDIRVSCCYPRRPRNPPPTTTFTPTSKTIFRMLTPIFFLFLIPLLSRRLITAEPQLASGDGGGGLWGGGGVKLFPQVKGMFGNDVVKICRSLNEPSP